MAAKWCKNPENRGFGAQPSFAREIRANETQFDGPWASSEQTVPVPPMVEHFTPSTKMVHVIEARTVTPNLGGRRGWTGAPAIELPPTRMPPIP